MKRGSASPAAFNLVRYFTGASLVIVLGGSLCVGAAMTWLVHAAFMHMERDEADGLAENLAILLDEEGFGSAQWAPEEVPDALRRRVRARLDNLGVREFTLLDRDGKTLEDFGPDRGSERAVWTEGLEQALEGRVTTRWEAPRGWFTLLLGSDPSGDIETYSPIRSGDTIVGVARVRRNLTPTLSQAHAMGPRLMALAALVGTVVFGLLWLLVRRADRALKRQDRLVEMVQDELEVSNQLLEQVNRRKDEFYVMCSNDLREPLLAVRSGCRALLASGPDALQAPQRIVASECLRNTETALELIDDLLDLAKMESGDADAHVERLDVVRTLEAVVAVQKVLANGLKTRVETRFPDGAVTVLGDHPKLVRALNRLLSSAITRAAGQGVVLKVESADDKVRVVVIERGSSIPATLPAPPIDAPTTQRSHDPLAIVRELLESQGATLDVASSATGTTLTVTLAS